MRRSLPMVMVSVAAFVVAAPGDIALAAQVAQAASSDELAREDLATAGLLLSVAGWIVFVGLRQRQRDVSSEPEPEPQVASPKLRLPDDPPALIHLLHGQGAARVGNVGTIVLDLARRGFIEIAEDEQVLGDEAATESGTWVGWRFWRAHRPRGELRSYENAVYTRLFASAEVSTSDDLIAWAEANRHQAKIFLDRVRRALLSDLAQRGYVEGDRRGVEALNQVIGGAVFLVGGAALVSGAWIGLLSMASGGLQVAASRHLRRRTARGSRRAREWAQVATLLRRVDEIDPPPDIDWERCFVCAVALGVGDAFIEALARRDRGVLIDASFASWYQSSRVGRRRLARASQLPTVIGQALHEVVAESDESASAPAPVERFVAWVSRSR